MRDLVRAAAQAQTFLDRQRWRYCFIGGLAVQKWGQVRVTQGRSPWQVITAW